MSDRISIGGKASNRSAEEQKKIRQGTAQYFADQIDSQILERMNMTTKIEGKIVSQRVATSDDTETLEVRLSKETVEAVVSKAAEIALREYMSEKVERSRALHGTTYKIKTPTTPHAIYITINDIVLNTGTEYEVCHPYEVFINTKDATHHQWITAITRLISAVFRKGGDVNFIVEELKSVFDPQGGYWQNGNFYPSLMAEIGGVIEEHLKALMLVKPSPKVLDESVVPNMAPVELAGAKMCPKCFSKTLVVLDGCQTCLSCGDSKCG